MEKSLKNEILFCVVLMALLFLPFVPFYMIFLLTFIVSGIWKRYTNEKSRPIVGILHNFSVVFVAAIVVVFLLFKVELFWSVVAVIVISGSLYLAGAKRFAYKLLMLLAFSPFIGLSCSYLTKLGLLHDDGVAASMCIALLLVRLLILAFDFSEGMFFRNANSRKK
jgi:hypothetical protein